MGGCVSHSAYDNSRSTDNFRTISLSITRLSGKFVRTSSARSFTRLILSAVKPGNVWLLRNGLQRFLLHRGDGYDAVTQPHNNCDETHLRGGDTSTFVVPSATIARSTFVVL